MKRKIGLLLFLILIIFITYIGVKEFVDRSYDENIPILAYHVISDKPQSDMEVSTQNFEKQMKFLHDYKFHVMSLNDVEVYKKEKKHLRGKKVAITFDDGSESYYLKAVPILEKYSFPSTNFIITSRINDDGYITKEEYEILKNKELVYLESHSYNLHNHDAAYSNNFDLYNDDIKINKDYKFKYYAYPFGISNDVYKESLKNNDIHLAFKYLPSHWLNINDDDYSLPRVPIYNSTSFFKFVLKVLIKR